MKWPILVWYWLFRGPGRMRCALGEDGGALKPVDRFDWERIVRRVQMPSSTKYLALILATYADQDGSRVHPGTERLTRVMCVSLASVKRGLAQLRAMGLIERTQYGTRRRGQADSYRLTAPENLLELPILDPDEFGFGDHE